MKKLTTLLMAVVLLVTAVMPMTAQAQATVTYSVDTWTYTEAIAAGDTVTFSLAVSSAQPLCMVQATLGYDHTKWEAVEGIKSEYLSAKYSFHEVNIAPVDNQTGEELHGKVKIGGMALENAAVGDRIVLATITLRALCTIDQDQTMVVEEVKAATLPTDGMIPTELACETVSGGIVIEQAVADKGDVNLDGTVSLPDATLLFYAVNGMVTLTEEQQGMADLDEDGTVSLNDATALFYRVNGLN